eukprot:m.1579440 g.1579440  ORF g.1579440 m.1579440 type:complete len:2016 (-) comp25315_c0_seq5:1540-7587(-)
MDLNVVKNTTMPTLQFSMNCTNNPQNVIHTHASIHNRQLNAMQASLMPEGSQVASQNPHKRRSLDWLSSIRSGSGMSVRMPKEQNCRFIQQLCAENNVKGQKDSRRELWKQWKDTYRGILLGIIFTQHGSVCLDERFDELALNDKDDVDKLRNLNQADLTAKNRYSFVNATAPTFEAGIASLPLSIQMCFKTVFSCVANSSSETKLRAADEIINMYLHTRRGQQQYSTMQTQPKTESQNAPAMFLPDDLSGAPFSLVNTGMHVTPTSDAAGSFAYEGAGECADKTGIGWVDVTPLMGSQTGINSSNDVVSASSQQSVLDNGANMAANIAHGSASPAENELLGSIGDYSVKGLLGELRNAQFSGSPIVGICRYHLSIPPRVIAAFATTMQRALQRPEMIFTVHQIINTQREGREQIQLDCQQTTVRAEGEFLEWTFVCAHVGSASARHPDHAGAFTMQDIHRLLATVITLNVSHSSECLQTQQLGYDHSAAATSTVPGCAQPPQQSWLRTCGNRPGAPAVRDAPGSIMPAVTLPAHSLQTTQPHGACGAASPQHPRPAAMPPLHLSQYTYTLPPLSVPAVRAPCDALPGLQSQDATLDIKAHPMASNQTSAACITNRTGTADKVRSGEKSAKRRSSLSCSADDMANLRMSGAKFMQGHMLLQGMRLFEAAVNDVVKSTMAESITEKVGDPYVAKFYENAQLERTMRQNQRQRLEESMESHAASAHSAAPTLDLFGQCGSPMAVLGGDSFWSSTEDTTFTMPASPMCESDMRMCDDGEMIALRDEMWALNDLDVGAEKVQPTPRWVRKCQEVQPVEMRKYTTEHRQWDTVMLLNVLCGFMHEVFAQKFQLQTIEDVHKEKERMQQILQVVRRRKVRRVQAGNGSFEIAPAEVLDTIHAMLIVCQRCQQLGNVNESGVTGLQILMAEAENWISIMQGASANEVRLVTKEIRSEDFWVQVLYSNLVALERFLYQIGVFFHYRDGTVTVDDESVSCARITARGATSERFPKVAKLKQHFNVIARAHEWFCYRDVTPLEYEEFDQAIKCIVENITTSDGFEDLVCDLTPLPKRQTLEGQLRVTIELKRTACRMAVPMARTARLFGRQDVVSRIVQLVESKTPPPRILITGVSGVGKGAVCVEVVHHPRIQCLSGLHAWVQGSSGAVFRRQMLEVFRTHRPHVVRHCEGNVARSMERIHRWLLVTEDWFFVIEDAATWDIWDVIPPTKHGRILLTRQLSNVDVNSDNAHITHVEKLEPTTVAECVEILAWEYSCAPSLDTSPEVDNEAQTRQRCEERGIEYIAPSKKSAVKRRNMIAQLHLREELTGPLLRTFINDTLASLPLSVSICAHLLGKVSGVDTVSDLIKKFQRMDLPRDNTTRNMLCTSQHEFGLYLTVRVMLDLLMSSHDQKSRQAVALLFVLSLLDRANTPTRLLLDHDIGAISHSISTGTALTPEHARSYLGAFESKKAYKAARTLAVDIGVLRTVGADDAVGVIHKLVLQSIRHYAFHSTFSLSSQALTLLGFATEILHHRFDFVHSDTFTKRRASLHTIAACTSAFCDAVLLMPSVHQASQGTREHMCEVLNRFVNHLLDVERNPSDAGRIAKASIDFHKRVLPENHQDIARPMGKLASALHDLGDHQTAVRWRKATLDYRRHALPRGHPLIASSMGNLALTLSALGKYDDALLLQQQTLELQEKELAQVEAPGCFTDDSRKRIYSNIATTKSNIASLYNFLGKLEQARQLQLDALELRKAHLPPDHHHIATSMSSLASAYDALGQHEEALKMRRAALEFRRRVLPHDHPHIASSLGNLARSFCNVRQHDKALEMQTEALSMHRQVLPTDHPDIATSLGTLGSVLVVMQRYDEALQRMDETLVMQRRVLDAKHPSLATTMANIALVLAFLGRLDEARVQGIKALAFRQKALDSSHPDIAHSMECLAYTYYCQGDVLNAVHMQTRCLQQLESLTSRETAITTAKKRLAVMQRRSRDPRTAERDIPDDDSMRPLPCSYPPVGMFNDGYSMSM